MVKTMQDRNNPTIHLALRFHVNLYHSYRGDSLDDRGIGKDIRIIRGLLDTLDALEAGGLPVRAAWDIENYYSLELYLPRHAPDIIERIRGRVASGRDEIELMSWNNGLLTAHDGGEFREAIARAIHNEAGSGVADLFPSWAPIARPQECMWNAGQIAAYRELGVEAVSLYYSAIPFNGFGSFVPPLPLGQRFNPLRLVDAESGASMRLLPAYNPGDVIEHGASLRGWITRLRRKQIAEGAGDLLLLLDMDADDSFWEGFLPPRMGFLPASLRGLGPMLRSLSGLPYLRFALPWDYLLSHPDLGEVSIGRDLADGAWDGYASWSEKAENTRLWTLLHEARRSAALAARIGQPSPDLREALDGALTARLLALSTTHFGMASPVMNAERLGQAFAKAEAAREAGERALGLASPRGEVPRWHFDEAIDALPRGMGAIVRLAPDEEACLANPVTSVVDRAGIGGGHGGRESPVPVEAGPRSIRAGDLVLEALPGGGLEVSLGGRPLFGEPLSRPWIRHGRARREARETACSTRLVSAALGGGRAGGAALAELDLSGTVTLPRAGRGGGDAVARWRHTYTVAAGMAGFRVDVELDYPRTARLGFDRAKAARLARDWDARWLEVAPFEMLPMVDANYDDPARVWRRDFTGRVSGYALDLHRLGPNRDLASVNNHVTSGWVALSAGGGGLLVAQSDEAQTLFAFCPMRVGFQGRRQLVRLNPFGSYAGPQWRYPTATTGLGRLAALATADNLDPIAPSWEGESLRASLLVLPFQGDSPPEATQRDALVFASRAFRA